MSLRTLRGDHNQCGGCLEYFNSTAAFDKHRISDGARRCRTATEMLLAGMEQNEGGWWLTSKNPQVYPSTNSRQGDLPADGQTDRPDGAPPAESEAA